MSLVSLALPAIRVYWIGFRVVLHQLLRRLLRPGWPLKPVFPLQNGNVAIVTGGTRGIGYHTVKYLARLGMHVIIAGNKEKEGQETVMKIKEEALNAKAAVMLVPERKTEDGFEEHFGINYMGHFLLTNLLLETLKQSGTHSHNARIVTLSSATHYVAELRLNDLQSSCLYSPHGAYAQSKLALVMSAYRLQHLLTAEGSHVTVNVVDPGVVNTDLYQNVCWAAKMVKWMTGWLLLKVPGEPRRGCIHINLCSSFTRVGRRWRLLSLQRAKDKICGRLL
ncbi:Hypothetical predicted protein [Podarcis lilfordi]|uniref:Dehydrogenase/reductase X-linked n=1 Tax=Podarcis lilfordi TaxID=74358 RepID=A0AA35K7J5_9SAUR|nr:Hypothetical predicted protein [Podarcis lilfordi]